MTRLEIETLGDTLEVLIAILEALRTRHGDRYRDLERRIEAAAGPDSVAGLGIDALDGKVLIATPPPEWTAIIEEARRLGVI